MFFIVGSSLIVILSIQSHLNVTVLGCKLLKFKKVNNNLAPVFLRILVTPEHILNTQEN